MRNCLLISCCLNRRRPVAALVDVHRRNGHVYGKQSIQPFQIVSKKGKRKTFRFFRKSGNAIGQRKSFQVFRFQTGRQLWKTWEKRWWPEWCTWATSGDWNTGNTETSTIRERWHSTNWSWTCSSWLENLSPLAESNGRDRRTTADRSAPCCPATRCRNWWMSP